MDVMIEKFAQRHVKAVAEIEKECFAHPWSEKSLSEELENDISHFFVACQKNNAENVFGYIGMQSIVDGAYITNVAVFMHCRKHGIGDLLVKRAIACAKELKLNFITLEVRPSNKVAIDLYKKNGFENVGTRKNFYRDPTEDGLIMTLNFVKL